MNTVFMILITLLLLFIGWGILVSLLNIVIKLSFVVALVGLVLIVMINIPKFFWFGGIAWYVGKKIIKRANKKNKNRQVVRA